MELTRIFYSVKFESQKQLNKSLLPYKNIYQIISAKTVITTYVKISAIPYRMFSYELYIINCEQHIISYTILIIYLNYGSWQYIRKSKVLLSDRPQIYHSVIF